MVGVNLVVLLVVLLGVLLVVLCVVLLGVLLVWCAFVLLCSTPGNTAVLSMLSATSLCICRQAGVCLRGLPTLLVGRSSSSQAWHPSVGLQAGSWRSPDTSVEGQGTHTKLATVSLAHACSAGLLFTVLAFTTPSSLPTRCSLVAAVLPSHTHRTTMHPATSGRGLHCVWQRPARRVAASGCCTLPTSAVRSWYARLVLPQPLCV